MQNLELENLVDRLIKKNIELVNKVDLQNENLAKLINYSIKQEQTIFQLTKELGNALSALKNTSTDSQLRIIDYKLDELESMIRDLDSKLSNKN